MKEGWLGKIDRDSGDTRPWESHRYSWNWSSGYHYQSKVRRTAGSLKLRFKELWLNGRRNAPRNSVFHHEISRAINTQVPTSVVERECLRHLMWGRFKNNFRRFTSLPKCVCMRLVCVRLCSYMFRCLMISEGGIRYPGAGVTGACELPYLRAGDWTQTAVRTTNALNYWALCPSIQVEFKDN